MIKSKPTDVPLGLVSKYLMEMVKALGSDNDYNTMEDFSEESDNFGIRSKTLVSEIKI